VQRQHFPCGIGAGSGHKARERASCKRQVSRSNPLTGSQLNPDNVLAWREANAAASAALESQIQAESG